MTTLTWQGGGYGFKGAEQRRPWHDASNAVVIFHGSGRTWRPALRQSAAVERVKLQWTTAYNRLPSDTSDRNTKGNAGILELNKWRRSVTPCENTTTGTAFVVVTGTPHADSHLHSTATCDGLGQLALPK